MDRTLKRIKRAIVTRNYEFSFKALTELDADGLGESDALESVLNARQITKTLRSSSQRRRRRREYLHVIISPTFDGIVIYTKGKLVAIQGVDTYYFFVSSKRAVS